MGTDQQLAFDSLKTLLMSTPILAYPLPEQTFILDTDASNTSIKTSIGAVLSQIQYGVERHRIGKDHCNADALSRYLEMFCDCYKAGMNPLTLQCNGCQHCSKLHTQWGKFEADVDDVLPIATRRITAIDNTDSHLLENQFSKWTEAYPLADQTAETVAETVVREFFSRFGIPLEVHMDQGKNFDCGVMRRLLGWARTTPYHPSSNGLVERF
ncbi:Hypothetical predicted protein [Mytilus galloprovincialis]|uniref:Integrase catalytic domain-containing protein n=1 Tax=Mytilus galloprovincialis TaxID=29158 RepID=A0A8B6D7J3_MYTGA|nr:Hypothetical predicted protein [Mytilus galloprovincialis]